MIARTKNHNDEFNATKLKMRTVVTLTTHINQCLINIKTQKPFHPSKEEEKTNKKQQKNKQTKKKKRNYSQC